MPVQFVLSLMEIQTVNNSGDIRKNETSQNPLRDKIMKVDDRSAIAEHFISQLWQKKYFSTLPLLTTKGQQLEIISFGIRNEDAGPDFKNISIKIGNDILHGDLEIHRATEDWYLHQHHADPAYNNVVLHLIIGTQINSEPSIKLNRRPIPVEIFVNIPDEKFKVLEKKYGLKIPGYSAIVECLLSEEKTEKIITVVNHFGRERMLAKAERFREQHQTGSWDQVLYLGIMEALGYSKNQIPFRRLANLLPFEALTREDKDFRQSDSLLQMQGLLLGAAGLLPSQDPSFDWRKIGDRDTLAFVPALESAWKDFFDRLGIEPMGKDEWLFFRLRPTNFPTRRLAGASRILQQFMTQGILEKILKIVEGLKINHLQMIKELENCFICQTEGYWATHYRLEEKPSELINEKQVTLVGKDRAREIVVNVILPVLLSYANEIDDLKLKTKIIQIYQEYPRGAPNSIVKKMIKLLFENDPNTKKQINTSAKQQGLIHLYKLYCRKKECDRCCMGWEQV